MEEHFLRFFTSRKELHIIKDQKINLQIKILKILELVILECVQELIGEIVLINIQHNFARHVVLDLIADSLYKVCLSNTNTSVKHQRIK